MNLKLRIIAGTIAAISFLGAGTAAAISPQGGVWPTAGSCAPGDATLDGPGRNYIDATGNPPGP